MLPDHDDPYERASCLYSPGDYVRAREIYEQLAEQDIYARIFLARMVETGRGSTPDVSRARSLLESAAEGDSLYARFRLAKFCMRMGEPERAFNSMVELTAKGYSPAIYWLGRMFAEGTGTPQDMPQSRYYLEYVAVRGHVWANATLSGLIYGQAAS